MKISDLKIGTKLELELYDSSGEKVRPTFMSEMELVHNERSATVAAPFFEGNILPVRIGTLMNVYFIRKRDEADISFYVFKARVRNRGFMDNIAILDISVESEIVKIQRRQYFRFECSIPIRFGLIPMEESHEASLLKGITRDISGGGLCLLSEDKQPFGGLLECELELGDSRKVSFTGRIVRVNKYEFSQKYKYSIGILYEKIENREREAIIKFIFEEQRKLRKKGLI